MIKEICKEIDVCIENKNLSKKLVDLISDFLKKKNTFDTKDSDMVLSLDNEIGMFIAGCLTHDSEFNENSFTFVPMPEWLIEELKTTKQEYIEFWNKLG